MIILKKQQRIYYKMKKHLFKLFKTNCFVFNKHICIIYIYTKIMHFILFSPAAYNLQIATLYRLARCTFFQGIKFTFHSNDRDIAVKVALTKSRQINFRYLSSY
jgi:hypothetical protein